MLSIHNQTYRVINVDKNAAYPKALDKLQAKKELPQKVELRHNKYLNNMVESVQWLFPRKTCKTGTGRQTQNPVR